MPATVPIAATYLNLHWERRAVSLLHLKAAVASGDADALIRYVRLHVGDGDEDGASGW